MNPDTKITTEEMRAICAKHNIVYHSHSRITHGFSHEVHRLNDDLVIKVFNADDSRSFKTESAVLSSDLPFLKPKFIAAGEKNDIIKRNYVIMSYVQGASLGSRWHLATDIQREELIKTLCQSLRAINKLNPEQIALETEQSWKDSIVARAEALTNKLQSKEIIHTPIAYKVLRTIHTNADVLSNSPLYPVYWDIHFDNFIVNEDFKLQAFIDLENIQLTPLDYPLVFIQKMTDEPEKYLREEDEKFADKKDYAKLKDLYRKYYPQMFAFDNLDTRIKMYQLLDTLHLLVDWSYNRKLHEELDKLISEY